MTLRDLVRLSGDPMAWVAAGWLLALSVIAGGLLAAGFHAARRQVRRYRVRQELRQVVRTRLTDIEHQAYREHRRAQTRRSA